MKLHVVGIDLGKTVVTKAQPFPLQLLVAWNSPICAPRCKVSEVRHQWRCTIGRLDEYGGFACIREKYFIDGVLRTISLLNHPEDRSFPRS